MSIKSKSKSAFSVDSVSSGTNCNPLKDIWCIVEKTKKARSVIDVDVDLLVEEASALVPLLAVLAAAADVGDRQVAEVLHEKQLRYRKAVTNQGRKIGRCQ